MSPASISTGKALAQLVAGKSLALAKIAGGGTLEARRISSGVVFYWRRTVAGATRREPIGAYDPKAPPQSLAPVAGSYGYSVKAAERTAERMASEDAVERARGSSYDEANRAKQAATKAAKAAQAHLKTHTLLRLLEAYCDYLQGLGRQAHANARSIFTLHVYEAWPTISSKPACQVTKADVIQMLQRVHSAGKARTSNKLRSYLSAAYQVALDSDSSAAIPARFRAYHVQINPVAGTKRDTAADRADKNPLSSDEMRTYWGIIKDLSGIKGQALRLHLLTGAPRIAQVVRVRSARDGYIELLDGKGRPGKPARPYALPLIGKALDDFQNLPQGGEWLLSTDGGVTHIANTTLSGWAKEAAGNNIKGFQAKRLRSGVETLLASLGVSQEVRGRLQSHGVSGVQSTHYNAYDYMAEKVAALEALHRALEPTQTKVILLPNQRRKA